jgi:hypothetical protein
MPMGLEVSEYWRESHLVVVPHAWRGDGLWVEMQAESQERHDLARDVCRTVLAVLISRFREAGPPDRVKIGDTPA